MKNSILTLCFLFSLSLSATDYYVSATGSNSNSGTSSSDPFLTIQHAADLTLPGDVVYIMDGVYSNQFTWQDLVLISRSGTAAAPIVYRNLPGHSPKIEFDGWHGIKIEGGVSYIEIEGLEIEGNNDQINLNDALNQPGGCNDPNGNPDGFFNGNGIASDGRYNGKNHHLTIRNCKVYNCAGAGISAIHSDYVTVENCEVYNNAWYSLYGNSGITFYQLYNFDSNPGIRNVIRNNVVYNNRMDVPWIEFCEITDGNGIIIDDSRNTQNGSTNGIYTGRTLVENNVVYENGGRGIHVFESNKVDVLNNTTYANGQSTEIDDGEITVIFADDVQVRNNIIYAKTGERLNKIDGTNVSFDFNLNFNSTLFDQVGNNSISGDPLFADLTGKDFSLDAGSPAIDGGTDAPGSYATTDITGTPRPVGALPDMGAFEAMLPLPVAYLSPLRAEKTADNSVRLSWTTETEDNASHFILQHSEDAQNFTNIARKDSQNAGNSYRYLHADPSVGVNYYRLKQTDLNGDFSYSKIAAVKIDPLLQVFPNPPANGFFRIKNYRPGQKIVLTDTSGKIIQTEFSEAGEVSVGGLAAGVYYLTLLTKSGLPAATERVVIP